MKLCATKFSSNTQLELAYNLQSEKTGVLLESNGNCIHDYRFYHYKTIEILTYIFYGIISLNILIFILVCMCFYCNRNYGYFTCLLKLFDIISVPVPVLVSVKPHNPNN